MKNTKGEYKEGLHLFTYWKFKGVSIPTEIKVIKTAEIDDINYQHEYQQIICQIWAKNKHHAQQLITEGE